MALEAGDDEPLSDDAYENLPPTRLFILQMKYLLSNKLAGKRRDHAIATTLAGAQYLLKESGKEPDPANPKHEAACNRRAAWAALLREDPSIEQYSVGMQFCTTAAVAQPRNADNNNNNQHGMIIIVTLRDLRLPKDLEKFVEEQLQKRAEEEERGGGTAPPTVTAGPAIPGGGPAPSTSASASTPASRNRGRGRGRWMHHRTKHDSQRQRPSSHSELIGNVDSSTTSIHD